MGIMLYGDGRVSERRMSVATSIVSVGTMMSTFWILSANSWMQQPSGYSIVDGVFTPSDWGAAIFTQAFWWRFPHMVLGVLISTARLIAGIAAHHGRTQPGTSGRCPVLPLGSPVPAGSRSRRQPRRRPAGPVRA
ncbi:cytochrome ubiquinol oxidase subunit I [Streptomyces sp. NBC_01506]|uniref:cytochrome ubiquinol oxidase subunit I n=1 Tax=Streptomyces sp. NBC_01506 TaxID=2903887 RepID=UPI0038651033